MTSECIYPQIEEQLVPAHENEDYESDYATERYDFVYRKWASKQEFISLVRSLSALDLQSAQHVEDIHNVSADDLKPIVKLNHSNKTNDISNEVPELHVSNSPSPPEYPFNYACWGNADDIPTRVPSATIEDFPPLVRCRDEPAMGYSHEYIMDGEESVFLDWSFPYFLHADDYEYDEITSVTENVPLDSSLSSCKEKETRLAESKDDEGWAFISADNSMILRPSCTDTLDDH